MAKLWISKLRVLKNDQKKNTKIKFPKVTDESKVNDQIFLLNFKLG